MQHQMQVGFGAQVDAPDRKSGNPILDGPSIFRISNKMNENRCTVVLLNDNPAVCYRHSIKVPYVPGKKGTRKDIKIREARMTCANPNSKDRVPRECKLCEAMLRHDDKLKRKFTSNLSLIDQRVITSKKGNNYYDMKKALELDYAYHKVFEETMRSAPDGRLAPKQYTVMRPTGEATQTRTFGDSWTMLRALTQPNELLQFFWESKAIPGMMKAAQEAGEQLGDAQQAWQTCVQRLIEPIPTSDFFNYDPELAEMFIQLALGRDYDAEQQGQTQTYHNMGGGAPPMPGAAMPAGAVPSQPGGGLQPPPGAAPSFQQPGTQGAQAAPAPAMAPPMGQAPQAPPGPAQQYQGQQQAPQQGYQQPPQQGYPPQQPQGYQQPAGAAPMAPPMTANPTQQQAPQGFQAPPQAPPQPAMAQQPGQQQYAAPAAPQQPQQAPQGQGVGQYNFQQPQASAGWSQQFPGQQPVAPPPAQQGAPQQQQQQAPQAPPMQSAPPPAAPPQQQAPQQPPQQPGGPQVPSGIDPGF